jgi:UDP-N-acetylmuramate: L-alanyl-gamma-D-glutamyl-meso-diaminopimelate ligase
VKETLAALRARHPTGRLFAVFEARSATACRRMHQTEYAASFDSADRILLAPLGRTNLRPEEALDLDQLVTDLTARGRAAQRYPSADAIVEDLGEAVEEGDVIALLSNGAFDGIHQKVLSRLERLEQIPKTRFAGS